MQKEGPVVLFLFIVLLAIHLICMNVATAGPLVCLWAEWREARGCVLGGRVGRYLANCSVITLVIGSLIGLAAALLVWSPRFAAALAYLWPRVWPAGVMELLFSLVLLVIYAVWWQRSTPTTPVVARLVRALLPLAAGTNLLYHFPPLFVMLAQLLTDPADPSGEKITGAQFRRLLLDPEVLSRSTHFVLASFAVCGTLMMWRAARLWTADPTQSDQAKRVAVWGGTLAAIPTFLQLPVGLWVMIKLPRPSMMRLMGDDLGGTVMLVLSILFALYLMHRLSKAMLGKAQPADLVNAVVVMFIVIVLMTGTLIQSRPPRDNPGDNVAPEAADVVDR
jgi:hypothetical protein